MLTAMTVPVAMVLSGHPAAPSTTFRKVERLVQGKASAIEFEHLRPGDVMRFVDTPNTFYRVSSDPVPVEPRGNFAIEMSGRIEVTNELLADPGALAKFQLREFGWPGHRPGPPMRPPRPGDDTGERG